MNEIVVPIVVAVIVSTPATLVAMSGRRHAKGANEAVNCRPPGAQTLAEDVREIAADVRELRSEQASLAVIVGEHMANGG